MNVVHLNTNRRWGGGEAQILQLMRGLRHRAMGSVLLARPGGDLFARASAEPELRVLPFEFRTRYNPLTAVRLRNLLLKLEADVLHLHDGRAVALGVPAARGLPDLALVVHRRISSPMRRNPLSRAHYRAAHVDAFIAVSESARRTLLDISVSPERTHVVPSGVDADRLQPVPSRAERLRQLELRDGTWVGTVGTLEPKKDIHTFVRTAGLLAREHAEMRFLVVGDGRQREALERLAREAGLGERLLFTGCVVDAHRYIAAMDVFVFPSLREGSPGVLKEAMALGVPTVAADSPGTDEVLREETGVLVPQGDARRFASAVRDVLANPDRTRRMVELARRRVEQHYTIESTVERTLEVYRGIVSPRLEAVPAPALVYGEPSRNVS